MGGSKSASLRPASERSWNSDMAYSSARRDCRTVAPDNTAGHPYCLSKT